MKPGLVPGRWPGATLAALGVLSALPGLVWPVLITTYPSDDTFESAPWVQHIWAWGKVLLVSEPTDEASPPASNTLGLVVFLVALVVGAGAAAAWALVGREEGRALGVAGTTFLAATQLVFSAQWEGQRQGVFFGLAGNDLSVEHQPAGWSQLASAALLLIALGFMLWRPVKAWSAPTWRRLNGAEPETGQALTEQSDEATRASPMGSARLRGADEIGRRAHPAEGQTVEFSDAAPHRDDRPGRRSGRRA